ncbi:MAG: chromate transporter [Firmicutes bacterium]|nr:chromate transporter [Bacillota bacterium]
MHLLLKIFIAFFKIGLFTFGGGHAMVPLIQKEVVDGKGWIDEEDFVDILALAQTAPGPVAANTSVFVGYRLVGISGAIWALLGAVLPSFIVILVVAMFFTKVANSPVVGAIFSGIRPAVVALVASAAITIGKTAIRDFKGAAICVAAFIAVAILDVHPIFIIIGSGVIGYIFFKDDEIQKLNNKINEQ